MNERKGAVTMQGKPLTLIGNELKVGDKAPDFEVVDNELKPFKFSSLKGKVCLLISVPSLDTSVCNRETHRFNQEVSNFKDQVSSLVISMDLPFAQKRWCGAEGTLNLKVLSDYKKAEFGEKYGVLIQELRLLARAIFIVDQTGTIRYSYLCKEVTEEPPYEQVLQQLNQCLAGAK